MVSVLYCFFLVVSVFLSVIFVLLCVSLTKYLDTKTKYYQLLIDNDTKQDTVWIDATNNQNFSNNNQGKV